MPKTAGSSIRSAIRVAKLHTVSADGARASHARARDYIEAMGRDRWDQALRFAVVRDPFARLVSCWAYAFGTGVPSVEGFRQWVSKGCPLHHRYHIDVGAGRRIWMSAPQVDWLVDESGTLVVPTILRVESLMNDWARLSGTIGAPRSLEHRNTSEHGPVAGYYDAPTRDFVLEHYARDFELLGYAAEGCAA